MSARPKLAVVLDYLPRWLVANFQQTARLVDLVILETNPPRDTHDDGTSIGDHGISCHRIRSSKPIFVASALDQINPDVVLALGWSGLKHLSTWHWACRHDKPIIVATDTNSFDFRRTFWKEFFKRRLLANCTIGWAAGQHSADYLRSLGMDEQRVLIGPVDTIDSEHFARVSSAAVRQAKALREEKGLPERYFLTVSRLAPEKNLFRLLDAYYSYRKYAGPNAWALVIAGDGPLRAPLAEGVRKRGITQNVVMPGWVDFADMPKFYGLASAFILASRKDTWGCVVNEAAACGLPLLVSRQAGSAMHLVRHGQNGFILDPNDTHEIAQRMNEVADAGTDRAAMGRLSLEIAKGWTPRNYARSLADAVHAAIKLNKPRRRIDKLIVNILVLLLEFRSKSTA